MNMTKRKTEEMELILWFLLAVGCHTATILRLFRKTNTRYLMQVCTDVGARACVAVHFDGGVLNSIIKIGIQK